MLSLLVLLWACSACGGHQAAPPTLARADAQPLAALARQIAGETDPCAQQRDIRTLQQRTIALVSAGRVPAGLQDTLVSGVNALASDTRPCVPAVPATTTASTPPPAPPPEHGRGHEKHHDHGHHGHGHGNEGD